MSRAVAGYRAPWWLPGGHLQTLAAALAPRPRPDPRRERWETPDGDFIDLDWYGAAGAGRLLALFHGLEGSSGSHYARALVARACAEGWRCVVPHFRGCSGEPNRLARAYHSGDSAELEWVLQKLASAHKDLVAVGVSLGANVLLKWLGERGAEATRSLRRAAAVSTPLELAASAGALDRGLNRQLYTRMFLATLKRKAAEKSRRFPGRFDAARMRAARSLREYDDAFTAPLHGFRDADDYYARSSSAPRLGAIAVPTLLLNARNDPFLPAAVLDRIEASAAVTLEFPAEGGHAGFPGRGDWLSRRLMEFLA